MDFEKRRVGLVGVVGVVGVVFIEEVFSLKSICLPSFCYEFPCVFC